MKILNRFGAIASKDTHSRLVTYVSSIREKEIKLEMTPDVFRLASIDNDDILPLHASAYAGKPSNIWHGTSVQCVEPKPKSQVGKAQSRVGTPLSQPGSLSQESTPLSQPGSLSQVSTPLSKPGSLSQVGTPLSQPGSLSQVGTPLSQPCASHISLSQESTPLS